jgi:hypothetical protein
MRDDDGKWMASTDEESWSDSERFETREDALQHAITQLAPDNGLEDGAHVHTGQVRAVDPDDLATAGADASSVIDGMTSWLHDNVGEFEVECAPGDEDDLQARLNAAIRGWIVDRKIQLPYHIDAAKSEVWRQCTARAVGGDLDGQRCCLHNGHGLLDGTAGDHEWH